MTLFLKDNSVVVCDKNENEVISAKMMFALGVATCVFEKYGFECIVTSGRDGIHNSGSLHSMGQAVDLRTRGIDYQSMLKIRSELEAQLASRGYDVVLENLSATRETTGAHIHIEYDPKGRKFWSTH